MNVHLEIYVTDAQKQLQAYWRRVLHDLPMPPLGTVFLLWTRDKSQSWYFPSGGVETGQHYDTALEAYVVWVRMTEPNSFENFGFIHLEKTRA